VAPLERSNQAPIAGRTPPPGSRQLPKADHVVTAAGEALGAETILVVDGDRPLRELTGKLLLDNGYTVLQAANGTEALRLSIEHSGRIDLLLTDVLMPGMDGPELAERVVYQRPETRVLLMSGYAAEALVCSGVRPGEVRFLAKPFSVDELEREIRASIDGDVIERPESSSL